MDKKPMQNDQQFHSNQNSSKLPNFIPVFPKAEQMLLGTLLGDGYMQWGCRFGRYTARHALKQREYCELKAALLGDYVKTLPKISRNGGFGDWLCTFSTVTTPAFEFLRELCFQQDPRFLEEPRRLRKWVNPAWLAKLTWEGIAFWYMDDGSLSIACKNTRVAAFSTHRFPKEQVELLADMLTERGVEAKACATRVRKKVFWTIRLTAASTRIFAKHVAPFVHPTLSYKIDVREIPTPPCQFCGAPVYTHAFNREIPCCENLECRRIRDRERRARNLAIPGRRELKNAKEKARRDANLAEARAKQNEGQRRRYSSPEYRAKWNAWKREWRRKRKEQGLPKM